MPDPADPFADIAIPAADDPFADIAQPAAPPPVPAPAPAPISVHETPRQRRVRNLRAAIETAPAGTPMTAQWEELARIDPQPVGVLQDTRGRTEQEFNAIQAAEAQAQLDAQERQRQKHPVLAIPGVAGFTQSLAGTVESVKRAAGLTPVEDSLARTRQMGDILAGGQRAAFGDSMLGRIVGGTINATGGFVADLPTMVLPGAAIAKRLTSLPVVAAGLPYGARAFEQTFAETGDAGRAAVDAAIESLIPAAFGKTGVERILADPQTRQVMMGLRQRVQEYVKQGGLEAAEEILQEVGGILNDAAHGEAVPWEQVLERIAVAGLTGQIAGSGMAMATAIVPETAPENRPEAIFGAALAAPTAGPSLDAFYLSPQQTEPTEADLRRVGETPDGRPIFETAPRGAPVDVLQRPATTADLFEQAQAVPEVETEFIPETPPVLPPEEAPKTPAEAGPSAAELERQRDALAKAFRAEKDPAAKAAIARQYQALGTQIGQADTQREAGLAGTLLTQAGEELAAAPTTPVSPEEKQLLEQRARQRQDVLLAEDPTKPESKLRKPTIQPPAPVVTPQDRAVAEALAAGNADEVRRLLGAEAGNKALADDFMRGVDEPGEQTPMAAGKPIPARFLEARRRRPLVAPLQELADRLPPVHRPDIHNEIIRTPDEGLPALRAKIEGMLKRAGQPTQTDLREVTPGFDATKLDEPGESESPQLAAAKARMRDWARRFNRLDLLPNINQATSGRDLLALRKAVPAPKLTPKPTPQPAPAEAAAPGITKPAKGERYLKSIPTPPEATVRESGPATTEPAETSTPEAPKGRVIQSAAPPVAPRTEAERVARLTTGAEEDTVAPEPADRPAPRSKEPQPAKPADVQPRKPEGRPAEPLERLEAEMDQQRLAFQSSFTLRTETPMATIAGQPGEKVKLAPLPAASQRQMEAVTARDIVTGETKPITPAFYYIGQLQNTGQFALFELKPSVLRTQAAKGGVLTATRSGTTLILPGRVSDTLRAEIASRLEEMKALREKIRQMPRTDPVEQEDYDKAVAEAANLDKEITELVNNDARLQASNAPYQMTMPAELAGKVHRAAKAGNTRLVAELTRPLMFTTFDDAYQHYIQQEQGRARRAVAAETPTATTEQAAALTQVNEDTGEAENAGFATQQQDIHTLAREPEETRAELEAKAESPYARERAEAAAKLNWRNPAEVSKTLLRVAEEIGRAEKAAADKDREGYRAHMRRAYQYIHGLKREDVASQFLRGLTDGELKAAVKVAELMEGRPLATPEDETPETKTPQEIRKAARTEKWKIDNANPWLANLDQGDTGYLPNHVRQAFQGLEPVPNIGHLPITVQRAVRLLQASNPAWSFAVMTPAQIDPERKPGGRTLSTRNGPVKILLGYEHTQESFQRLSTDEKRNLERKLLATLFHEAFHGAMSQDQIRGAVTQAVEDILETNNPGTLRKLIDGFTKVNLDGKPYFARLRTQIIRDESARLGKTVAEVTADEALKAQVRAKADAKMLEEMIAFAVTAHIRDGLFSYEGEASNRNEVLDLAKVVFAHPAFSQTADIRALLNTMGLDPSTYMNQTVARALGGHFSAMSNALDAIAYQYTKDPLQFDAKEEAVSKEGPFTYGQEVEEDPTLRPTMARVTAETKETREALALWRSMAQDLTELAAAAVRAATNRVAVAIERDGKTTIEVIDTWKPTTNLGQRTLEHLTAMAKLGITTSVLRKGAEQAQRAPEAPRWARRDPNGYEVSSAGDRRFSAMYAKLPDGRTIEAAYQQAKGSGKGQPAKDPAFDYWGTYLGLWHQWAAANPELVEELRRASAGKVLTDKFATTDNNQARALATILAERATEREAMDAPGDPDSPEAREAELNSLEPPSDDALRETEEQLQLERLEFAKQERAGARRLGANREREDQVPAKKPTLMDHWRNLRAGFARVARMGVTQYHEIGLARTLPEATMAHLLDNALGRVAQGNVRAANAIARVHAPLVELARRGASKKAIDDAFDAFGDFLAFRDAERVMNAAIEAGTFVPGKTRILLNKTGGSWKGGTDIAEFRARTQEVAKRFWNNPTAISMARLYDAHFEALRVEAQRLGITREELNDAYFHHQILMFTTPDAKERARKLREMETSNERIATLSGKVLKERAENSLAEYNLNPAESMAEAIVSLDRLLARAELQQGVMERISKHNTVTDTIRERNDETVKTLLEDMSGRGEQEVNIFHFFGSLMHSDHELADRPWVTKHEALLDRLHKAWHMGIAGDETSEALTKFSAKELSALATDALEDSPPRFREMVVQAVAGPKYLDPLDYAAAARIDPSILPEGYVAIPAPFTPSRAQIQPFSWGPKEGLFNTLVKRVAAQHAMSAAAPQIVVPENIGRELGNMAKRMAAMNEDQGTGLAAAAKMLRGISVKAQLSAPWTLPRYILQNVLGNTSAMVYHDPQSLAYYGKALGLLWRYYKSPHTLTEQETALVKLMEQNDLLTAGMSAELQDSHDPYLHEIARLTRYDDRRPDDSKLLRAMKLSWEHSWGRWSRMTSPARRVVDDAPRVAAFMARAAQDPYFAELAPAMELGLTGKGWKAATSWLQGETGMGRERLMAAEAEQAAARSGSIMKDVAEGRRGASLVAAQIRGSFGNYAALSWFGESWLGRRFVNPFFGFTDNVVRTTLRSIANDFTRPTWQGKAKAGMRGLVLLTVIPAMIRMLNEAIGDDDDEDYQAFLESDRTNPWFDLYLGRWAGKPRVMGFSTVLGDVMRSIGIDNADQDIQAAIRYAGTDDYQSLLRFADRVVGRQVGLLFDPQVAYLDMVPTAAGFKWNASGTGYVGGVGGYQPTYDKTRQLIQPFGLGGFYDAFLPASGQTWYGVLADTANTRQFDAQGGIIARAKGAVSRFNYAQGRGSRTWIESTADARLRNNLRQALLRDDMETAATIVDALYDLDNRTVGPDNLLKSFGASSVYHRLASDGKHTRKELREQFMRWLPEGERELVKHADAIQERTFNPWLNPDLKRLMVTAADTPEQRFKTHRALVNGLVTAVEEAKADGAKSTVAAIRQVSTMYNVPVADIVAARNLRGLARRVANHPNKDKILADAYERVAKRVGVYNAAR